MAHNQQLRVTFLHRSSVELQRSLVEPAGSWFLVVMKAQPDVAELAHLRVVFAPPKVDDVRYAECAKSFNVPPSRYCAAKCKPLSHKERLQAYRLSPSVLNGPAV